MADGSLTIICECALGLGRLSTYSYVSPDAVTSRSLVKPIILSRHAGNTDLIMVIWRKSRFLGI
ncbi:MAG: hypothetical protein M3460_09395 [Actinomycetota bacterium]|nr:hypothetical protein [Actinomycetota bacterium]